MSDARADGRSRLALPLTFSTIGHAAVVAALIFVRPAPAKQLPPMYEVVDYYADRGVLSTVAGEGKVADVTVALLRAIAQSAQ